MKTEVTISDNTNGDDEDDTDVMAFIASNNVTNPLNATSDVQEETVDEHKYEHDELFHSYNALLFEHIKYENDKRKAM